MKKEWMFSRIYLLLGAAVFIALLTSVFIYQFNRDRNYYAEQVTHTFYVIESLESINTYLYQAESGKRGYLLTGDPEDLEFWSSAIDRMEQEWNRLEELTSRYGEVPESLILRLTGTLENRVEAMSRTIALYESEGLQAALDEYSEVEIRQEMDGLQQVMAEFYELENQLLQARDERYTLAGIQAQWIAVGGLLFITVILLLAAFIIRKRVSENRRLLTDIQELNSKLFQSNEREVLKNRYLGIVTHDLRNPLHAVLSFSLILQEDESSLNEEQIEYLGYISDAATQMKKLVAEMHDIQKVEEGVFGVQLEELRVHRILDGLVAGHRVQAEEKGIEILLHDDIRDQVFTIDKSLFFQVADNLISNAIKFSPGGTRVDVTLDQIDDDLRLQVQDQGPGIKQEEMPYLFNRFQKLSNKPTGNESSTGLGLSIVKDRVDAAGGTIRCESRVGEGALFVVRFPGGKQQS